MVDEQEPTKRVVKRVVKKTVVRPTSAAARPAEPAPRVRYGRPVATATKTSGKAQSKAVGAPQAKVRTRPTSKPAPPRQRVDLSRRIGAARERSAGAWGVVAGAGTDGARRVGTITAARARTAAGWRLPHLSSYPAAAITGAVVGVLVVVLGLIALSIFDVVRGVSSGGGLWGGLAVVAIAITAGFAGEALLRGFGSTSGRLTSFLAILLAVVAMLGLFLDVVDGWAALPLLPMIGIATFVLSRWLVDIAESTPPETD